MKVAAALSLVLVLSGCVTKSQLLPTDDEKQARLNDQPQLTCENVDKLISVNQGRVERLKTTSAADTLGFLLDFNIGNATAKSNGIKEANKNIVDLRAWKKQNCSNNTATTSVDSKPSSATKAKPASLGVWQLEAEKKAKSANLSNVEYLGKKGIDEFFIASSDNEKKTIICNQFACEFAN